jgi:hypothetical protein
MASEVPIGGDDDGDRFADEAHLVDRDRAVLRRRKRRPDRHRSEKLRQLRAGEDGFDAVHRRGGARVDRDDSAVRDVGALEREELHAGDLDVVDVSTEALDQARILTALDALADELGKDWRRHGYLPAFVAAYCTALTMC